MLDSYNKEIKNVLDWYIKTKNVILKAESLDPNKEAFLQPLHEQRYCLDHLMRAIQYFEDNPDDLKVKESINACIAHLQRAYSDCVEWMYISTIDIYGRTLSEYSTEQINTAFPKYYSEIKPNLYDIGKRIEQYKATKSIEETLLIEDKQTGNSGINIANDLETYVKELNKRESSLVEIRKKDKKTNFKRTTIKGVILPIIVGLIVGAILTLLVT